MIHTVAPVLMLVACGGTPTPATTTQPTAPASAEPSLVGTFHRADDRGTVMRFSADGTCAVAANVEGLAAPSHRCTWKLAGNRLTFDNTQGACADSEATRIGVYDIVVSDHDVSFKMVSDTCDRRMSIDGETWERLPN